VSCGESPGVLTQLFPDTGLWPDSQVTDAEKTALVDALRALPGLAPRRGQTGVSACENGPVLRLLAPVAALELES
jgi:hypothetical protein